MVDVALHESVFSLTEAILPEYGYAGTVRQRRGNALLGSAPSNVYPTGDGRYITIGANGDSIFRRFCAAIGRPELADDPKFAANQSRRTNVVELDAIIESWTMQHRLAEIWDILVEAEVPAAPVYSIADIVEDPHYRARDMILSMSGPDGIGDVLVPGIVPKFQEAPGGVRWIGGPVGQHTAAVLHELLSLGEEDITRLAGDGIIGLAGTSQAVSAPGLSQE